jgi:stage II sporulation protein D
MGITGSTEREILAFYYPGTVVGLTGRGISWQRLGGDGVTLMTTQPDRDRVLLGLAEHTVRSIGQQINLPIPRDIEVRVYPDVDTFRNATGEPGWVAAYTQGRRIHLQPADLLRTRGTLDSTLRHELLHVAVESQASPKLPVWFREGLVAFLSGSSRPAAGQSSNSDPDAKRPTGGWAADQGVRPTLDLDLRQTADPARARRAYEDAARIVANLTKRYGVAAVLGWLTTGLPAEVTKASTSQAATKSR